MSVKIRLARLGKKHAPIYRIVAADSRCARDGKHIEVLGTFNPQTDELVQFHQERVEYWISKGAIPTDAVKRIQRIHKKQGTAVS